MAAKTTPVVAITGASGFLGSTLQKYFVKQGWQVCALVRDSKKYKTSPGITYRSYDLTQPVDPSILLGVDYLIHAAYVKHSAKTADAMDINITGAKNILAASRKNKLRHNVFISSMSAHPGAESVYGRQKLQIEKLFSEPQDICLRPGLIIGNGGIVKNITQFMKHKHAVPLIGGGKQPLQVVSVNDLAVATQKALQSQLHGTFTVAHPTVYSYKQFYKKLARQLRVPVLFIPVPFGLLMSLLKVVDVLHLPLSIGKDNLLGLKKLISVDTAPDLKKLGVKLDDLDTILNKGVLQ